MVAAVVLGWSARLALHLGKRTFSAGPALSVAWPWVVVVGALVWAVGMVVEAAADRQLAAYRATPKPMRAPILSSGIWAWSRHPNYFGEALIWWGLWLVAGAASGWGPLRWTLPAPIVLTAIVTVVSGVRIAERRMRGRDGWDAYAARTPRLRAAAAPGLSGPTARGPTRGARPAGRPGRPPGRRRR